ncbi:PAS/PAC sensor hybrid histidine kinase [Nitritalea halalkaliphila LW7]|uniref:histidine kinase n=1 Tax=Nitritalea halalkaliphila LW7 TaxID=1189621 RepID=I5C2U3_9BACT|nr:PAS domain S-box protein [Nitritalea halalkaliphila]EIM76145.1 PAS/PAC sensor hybrid histidine kinase [Nitritalea halalkaliphila LW7]
MKKRLGVEEKMLEDQSVFNLKEKGIIQVTKGSLKEILEGGPGHEVQVDFWVLYNSERPLFVKSVATNLLHDPTVRGILFSGSETTAFVETEGSLKKRYALEQLINKISTKFVNANAEDLPLIYQESLRMLGEYEQADRTYIFLIHHELQEMENIYEWTAEGIAPEIHNLKHLPYEMNLLTMVTLARGDVFIVPDVEHMDDLFQYEQEVYKAQDIKSVMLIPIFSENKLIGFFGLDAVREKRDWVEKDEYVLRQLGDIYAAGLTKGRMISELKRNESLLASTELIAKSGSWRYSFITKRFTFSEGLRQLFELQQKEDSIPIQHFTQMIAEKGKTPFLRHLVAAVQGDLTSSGQFMLETPSGQFKHVQYFVKRGDTLENSHNEVYGYCLDVTHKQQAERYLRFQSQVLTQVNDAIFVTNVGLQLVYLNRAAESFHLLYRAFKQDAEISLDQLLEPSTLRKGTLEAIQQQLQLHEVWKGFLSWYQEGQEIPVELSASLLRNEDGDPIGYSFVMRDLTALRQQEALARQAQTIVENSTAILFTVNPAENFRITYITENVQHFGYCAADLVDAGVSLLDLVHEEDRPTIEAFYSSENRAEDMVFSGEYRLRCADGRYIWVSDKSTNTLQQGSGMVLHEGVIQDITEQKKYREALERGQRLYRLLASNLPGTGVLLLTPELEILVAEGSVLQEWEPDTRALERRAMTDFQGAHWATLQEAVKGSQRNQAMKVITFSHQERYYEAYCNPIIEKNQLQSMLVVIRDIHHEFTYQQALKESESKYRTLVEESTEIIFSISSDLRLSYISPNVTQYFGYSPEEVLGLSILRLISEEDREVFEQSLDAVDPYDFFAQHQFLEFKLRTKEGVLKVLSSNGKLVYGEDGEVTSYMGVARDITHLKETQKALYYAKIKAEEALRVKSQFLSIMSHEIRTPMNAVIGISHLLLQDNPRLDQLENLKTLQFSAENLMALINDILDFNKIDSGKLQLEHIPFQLKDNIQKIVRSYSYTASEKGLRLKADVQEGIPEQVLGDPTRISQILNNLVSNALKFTESGHVLLRVVLKEKTDRSVQLLFEVEDTGIGIPDDKKESIFEAFTQASSETTRKYGGTGLGLAIVKRLIEMHGSDIQVKDNFYGGTTFSFLLEFTYETVTEKPKEVRAVEEDQAYFSRLRVLVAEDNMVNQLMIRKFMERWGVGNIRLVDNGEEVLKALEEESADLLLLDLQMPVMDGFEAARLIRSNPLKPYADIPIIALTASSIVDIQQDIRAAGIYDHMGKPFDPQELKKKLMQVAQQL